MKNLDFEWLADEFMLYRRSALSKKKKGQISLPSPSPPHASRK